MINCISLLDGQELILEQGALLGEGTYGSVYALKSKGMETNLVCKVITLNHPEGLGFLSKNEYKRNYRYCEANREINGLYALGLLVGYQLKDDIFYLVMKRIKGQVLYEAYRDTFKPEKLFYKAFQRLKKLHRMGYAHLDPHPKNFIVSSYKPHKISLIDYSRLASVSFLGRLIDYKLFFSFSPTSYSITNFFVSEFKEYVQKHKVKSILGVLTSPLFIFIATVLALPSQIESEKATQFIINYFMYELVNSNNVGRESLLGLALIILTIPMIAMVMSNHWENGPALLQNEGAELFNPLIWLNTIYLVLNGFLLYSRVMTMFEDYLMPESILNKKRDLFFKQVHPLKVESSSATLGNYFT